MAFKLSSRSQSRLDGVNTDLVAVCERAIQLTRVDFGITCGMRTVAEQAKLVEQRRSQTMKSKHIEGLAIDVVAYFGSEISWDNAVYDDIADAFAEASRELDTPCRWGGAWHINDIGGYKGLMETAQNSYIDLRRSAGRRPFIDGPHFELSKQNVVAAEYS